MRPRALRAAIVAAAVVAAVAAAASGVPVVSHVAFALLACGLFVALVWGFWRLLRAFLWKVGRRLAFSYLLLGVLPIPMLLLLLGLGAYILAGFFLGHLYRDAVRSLRTEMATSAAAAARQFARTGRPLAADRPEVVYGFYRDGRRVAGDPRTPDAWPAWLEKQGAAAGNPEAMRPLVAGPGGAPTLGVAASREGRGVVALFVGDLDQELSERSDVWVEMIRRDEPDAPEIVSFEWGDRRIPLHPIGHRDVAAAEKFFKRRSRGEDFWDRPFLWWGDASGRVARLAAAPGGRPVFEPVDVTLHGTPRGVGRHLFSTSAELDAAVWGALVVVASLLFDIYLVAALMAVFMILGLSRAVNRLSRATAAVQAGDFSVRIPVRRRDQLGALQLSFNAMAENLQSSVAAAAQKEAIDKELAVARDLQQSLIPADLPAGESVEFATLFEPSAAIGGDYFDVLPLGEQRFAVFIADVSGHGLSTGLRMAMVKAALLILVQEESDPEAILRRLDSVVRTDGERRFFVTATLSLVDLEAGTLEIVNAGHPPVYLLREGRVEEVLLPSSPLGGLGRAYSRRTVRLDRGNVVVWLSDGLIEALDPEGDPLGYEEVAHALAGSAGTAAEVRDRLLATVATHAAGRPPADDRTLVVLRYLGPRHAPAETMAETAEAVLAGG